MFKFKKVISTNALIQTLSKLYPTIKLNDVISLKNKEYIYMGDIPSGIMYCEMSNDNTKLLKWQKIPLQTIWQINSNKVINLYIEHTNAIEICERKIYKLEKKMNTRGNCKSLKNR